MNRPMIWVSLAFAAGIGAVDLASAPALAVGGVSVTLLTLRCFARSLAFRDGLFIALVFFLAGSVWTLIRAPERHEDALSRHIRDHPNRAYTLEGVVADAPVFTDDTSYASIHLDVRDAWMGDEAVPTPGGMTLRWTEPTGPLHAGDRIRVRGQPTCLLSEVNLELRSAEDYEHRHGYHSLIRVRSDAVEHLDSPTFHLRYWTSRLRQWEASVFIRAAPESAQGLLRAVWLGDRTGISQATYQPFLETGTAHILAVSGVHIGILYLTLQLVLRGVITDRKRRAAVVLGAIIIFALVTGARTPILRATIMLSLYLWAEFLDRESDAPTALSLAAFGFLLVNPALLGDTGFALSFVSLGSILLFSDRLADRMTAIPARLRQSVSATLGVSVLPLPLTTHFFHILTIVGPLCNLFIIPLLTVLLWLCLTIVVVAPVSIEVARVFGHATAPIVWAIEQIAAWGAAIPYGHHVVTSPTWIACLAYGVGAWALFRWAVGRLSTRRGLSVIAIALAVTWVFWKPLSRPATVDFLDVGHGDATFVRTPGGTTLLVDGGNHTEHIDMGSRVVVPWLLTQGVDYLDYVVVTHPDQDHIGGLEAVLGTIPVGTMVLWPEVSRNETAQRLVAQCEDLDIPIRRVVAGDDLRAAGAHIAVIHPPANYPATEDNNQSIVLDLRWDEISVLLTGDIELAAERSLIPTLSPTNVLKVPHHGSHTSSAAAFLDATAPQLAVVSTRGSRSRLPMAPVVVQRYVDRAIPVYRTDYHGGVRLRFREDAFHVQTARGQRGYSLAPSTRSPSASRAPDFSD